MTPTTVARAMPNEPSEKPISALRRQPSIASLPLPARSFEWPATVRGGA